MASVTRTSFRNELLDINKHPSTSKTPKLESVIENCNKYEKIKLFIHETKEN